MGPGKNSCSGRKAETNIHDHFVSDDVCLRAMPIPLHAGSVEFSTTGKNIGNTRLNTVVVVEPALSQDWTCADSRQERDEELSCPLGVVSFSTQATFEATFAGVTYKATADAYPLSSETGQAPGATEIRSVNITAVEQANINVPTLSCTPPSGERDSCICSPGFVPSPSPPPCSGPIGFRRMYSTLKL